MYRGEKVPVVRAWEEEGGSICLVPGSGELGAGSSQRVRASSEGDWVLVLD